MNHIMRALLIVSLFFGAMAVSAAEEVTVYETCNVRPIEAGVAGDPIAEIATDTMILSDTSGVHATFTDGETYRWLPVQGYANGYVGMPCVTGVPIQDYSWAIDSPMFYITGGPASLRNRPALDGTYVRDIPEGTTVQVLAVHQGTDVRILVRSERATGWVNNADALINLEAPVATTPQWLTEPTYNESDFGNSGSILDPNRQFYSPDGDSVVDLVFYPGHLVFEGQTSEPEHSYHLTGAIRENGVYSVLAFNGMIEFAQGTVWYVRPDWDASFTDASQMAVQKSFSGELMVKAANGFTDDAPENYYMGNLSDYYVYTQDEVLHFPFAGEVLGLGQGGGSIAAQSVVEAGPDQPQEVAVNGLNLRDGSYAASDIGPDECANCYVIAVFIGENSATNAFEVLVGQGSIDFTYVGDHRIAVVFPASYDEAQVVAWLIANGNQMRLDLGLDDRTIVNVSGLPTLTGQFDITTLGQ